MIDKQLLQDRYDCAKKLNIRHLNGNEKEADKLFKNTCKYVSSLNFEYVDIDITFSKSIIYNLNNKDIKMTLEVFFDENYMESICTVTKRKKIIFKNSGSIDEMVKEAKGKIFKN